MSQLIPVSKPRHRVLIVGGGSIGERHLRCFLTTGRATVALCEQNPERVRQLAAIYPLTDTFTDFHAVDLAAFDAVVICVYADLHVPWAQRAIEAGAHVLIEKPLSNSPEGIAGLAHAAAQRGRVAAVAHVRRALRSSRLIRAELERGAIGLPLSLSWTLGYDHRVARPDYRSTYWRDRNLGGGVVLDLSSHASDLVQWLLGPVRSVVATYDRLQLEDTPCEDTLSYVLRFQRSQAIATLHCNAWQPHRSDALVVSGTNGTLTYDGVTGRLGVAERGGAWSWTEGLNGTPDAKGQVDEPFIVQAADFLDAIEGIAAPLCSLDDGRHTLEICAAVLASGAQRREVALPLAPLPQDV